MVKVASITNIIKGLKPRQQKTMKNHARHHSLKHMRSMARAMKKGATLAEMINKRPMRKRRRSGKKKKKKKSTKR